MNNFFFMLYQPLSQFEATLFTTSISFLKGIDLGLFFSSLFSLDFYFDCIFYILTFFLFDINNEHSSYLLNIISNENKSESSLLILTFVASFFSIAEKLHMSFYVLFKSIFSLKFGFFFISLVYIEHLSIILNSIFGFLFNSLYLNQLFTHFFLLVPFIFFFDLIKFILFVIKYVLFLIIVKLQFVLSFFFSKFNVLLENSYDLTSSDNVSFIDTSITKFHVTTFFLLTYFIVFFVLSFKNQKYYLRTWNVIVFSMIDEFLTNTISQQLGIKRGQKYSLFLKTFFFLVLFSNLFGLIPFSFTITSHLIYTFTLSLSILTGITILGFSIQGISFLKLLVPSGAPFALLLLLCPIEFVSYIARCFSLAIRLFANMMSGHTLLNILSGFVIKIANGGFLLISLVPLFVVIAVSLLEMGIAALQAYVFLILVCIYLKDAFEAGH